MNTRKDIVLKSLKAALPIMAGYVAIGIPCGIMESAVGLTWWMSFLVSVTFYSGAGQFMIPNLYLAGMPVFSIVASVSFVNSRQILYSTAFSPYFAHVNKVLSFFFAATVTDESFGVNMERYQTYTSWTPVNALLVNVFSMLSWASANALGCAVGSMLDLPLAITSFAMTSIFICLMCTQTINRQTLTVMAFAFIGVFVCKLVGLSGASILLGAIVGVVAGMLTKPVEGDETDDNE
jgi:4-azaleucine resistance transporter AzlC